MVLFIMTVEYLGFAIMSNSAQLSCAISSNWLVSSSTDTF